MFERSPTAARDVLAPSRWKLRDVFAGFDAEILMCDCADGAISCDGLPLEREASNAL